MPNPDLDPKNKLISVLNKLRTLQGIPTLPLEDFNFSTPTVYSGPRSLKNTRVILTPKAQSGFYGNVTLYYDRIDLSTLTGYAVEKGTATTVLGLLDEINEELGVELTALDVEEAALGNGTEFTLTASPQNLIFIGSTQIEFI